MKTKIRRWIEEYSPDFKLRLVKKGHMWQLRKEKSNEVEFESQYLHLVRDHLLRLIARYINEHTIYVDMEGKPLKTDKKGRPILKVKPHKKSIRL